MAKKKNSPADALAAARKEAKTARDWIDLSNRLYGPGGVISAMFPTEAERIAFTRSDESDKVHELFDECRAPASKVDKNLQDKIDQVNGAISIRMPRTVHAALVLEAKAEGVSLNQLCMAKLAVQLRALV